MLFLFIILSSSNYAENYVSIIGLKPNQIDQSSTGFTPPAGGMPRKGIDLIIVDTGALREMAFVGVIRKVDL